MNKILTTTMILLFASAGFSDPLDVHGMLLFGKKANYVSHLPMFHAPHDYQMIAEVDLADNGNGQTLAKYNQAKKKHTVFTLVPEPMDLAKVVSGEIRSFPATIFKGHFERGGTPIGAVLATVKKKFVANKIARGKGPSLDYLSFGGNGEYFLAHVIKGQPTYDAIYASSQPWQMLFPHCGRGGCPEPVKMLVPDAELPVVITATMSEFGTTHPVIAELGETRGLQVSIKEPFYVEYNELAH